MNHSLTEENYLKALFHLEKNMGEVSVNELSKNLDIKMPTVTAMMKKLSDKKLVAYQKYKPLKLTEKGRREAGLIIRKHRLTEMFLVEKMKIGWEEVHDIAEQIEHIKSTVLFEKMDELLGFPSIDPHGSPIPDRKGIMNKYSYRKLSDCKSGDRVKLSALINTSNEFLKFLNARFLKLGVKISINHVEPFDGSMNVSYSGRKNELLSHLVCEQILVE